ncbi:dihydroxyacetone kinase subunit DhaK [Paraliobacillus salinarum]|uniref:dihydroxyacetone kinase subunit DhaK n=1 Tax=Paraliobacillus salinarum TaxID=1158996 RepID=UPI0015F7552F|nr:dihydroxyacetone kinase subunit DhaK [Paraliobacillus salinarum]
MKKIINDASQVVGDMLKGMLLAHDDLIEAIDNTNVVVAKDKPQTVGLVSGGGSGHEPAHAGFVGDGMLRSAVLGEMFTSPTPDQVLEAIKASDTGQGVLLIVKNYTGDVMNFDMAKELAEMEGIEVDSVLVDDDIAVENSTHTAGKRGVAGTVLVHKILGKLARDGHTLQELKQIGDALVQDIHTLGVALSGATVPEVGKPGFTLDEDEMEYGVGIHGEPGYRREQLKSSREISKELVEKLVKEYNLNETKKIGLLVNGLGATPLMELYVFYQDVVNELKNHNVEVVFKKVGNFMTSIDMAGLSLTLIDLEDSSRLDALNAPVHVVSW